MMGQPEQRKTESKVSWKSRLVALLFLASVIVVILCVVILSVVPAVSKDALTHHLAVPKLYLKHGGVYEIPFMPFSYFPMNLDLLYMIPLLLGNDIAPKLIHSTFALLTAGLIFGYLKKRINTCYGLLGALFFLSIPMIVKLSITVYVDLGLIFFSTAALLLLFKWREKKFGLKYLIYSGVFCGLAMGTKYNGLITFFLLTLFVPFISSRYGNTKDSKPLRPVGYAALFFGVALIIFSPWMIRDFIWTGNPIYPLYDQWFNPSKYSGHKSIGIFAYRALVYHEKWWEILLLPLRIFFQGQDDSPQFFDGKLNPFLLIFPVLAFIRMRDDPDEIKIEKKVLLAYSLLYFSFAFFSSSLRIRYISPIIPPLVILFIFGVSKAIFFGRSLVSPVVRKMAYVIVIGAIGTAIGMNAWYVVDQFRYVRPFDYLSGKVSRDQYIERYRPEYPVMQFINKNLPSNAKVLFIFMGNRGYYCDRSYIFDMIQNKSSIANILRTTHDAKTLSNALRKDGITHLLVNLDILNRWATGWFEPQDIKALRLFFTRYAKVAYSKNGYFLFSLCSEAMCN